MFEKNDAILIFIGIVISAYMVISYDIARDWLEDPTTNIAPIAQAGMISLGVGSLIFYLCIRGKIK
ncbi:MAG: hypothetical protein K8Q88_06235 [Nitrosarchaeum sp.]|nr:hypothetical protein [Nitrosarchaeum sp.]